ncbi:MAG: hypothetical protein JW987_14395 [Anaerolineaceae bacterium]|nr:hypothetical protein [Anaerolineaceae bacterium]
MKWFQFKTTQARIAVLTGALALLAVVTAVVSVINAAAMQEELAYLKDLTVSLEQHADARAAVLKNQLAMKNMLLSDDSGVKDFGDEFRYQEDISEYAYSQWLAWPDEELVGLNSSLEVWEAARDQFIDKAWNGDLGSETAALLIDEVDPAAARLENEVQNLNAWDVQFLRDHMATLEDRTQTNAITGMVVLVLAAALVVWGVYVTLNISEPLDGLTSAVVAFENNTYRPEMLRRHQARPDDLGSLARAVGGMAESISASNRTKEQFLTAAKRFIPVQYLEFLEKPSITDVQLGDHVSAEMAVMFSDIRGFTSMSEGMTAKQNFDFVNEYLELVSPLIQKHEGFIVKFLGDGMMAIFPYGVDDAVKAGIEKEMAVQQFNERIKAHGLGPISVGIGIHTGPMMVGMIGESLRMQGDAFSDNVNLTSRIEGLNKFYGTSMIISQDTLDQLPQPVNYRLRYLGKAVVKGRVDPLGLYEILDGLSREVIARREETRADFEQGVALFAQGKLREAGLAFDRVLAQDPSDKTARVYLEQCADRVDRPLPSDWNGAIVMESK